MRFAFTVTAMLAATAVPASAWAWPDCIERQRPIRLGLTELDRSRKGRVVELTLRSRALPGETHVTVTLRRRYDPSGRTPYAVLYWLHGSGSDHRDWVDQRDGLALVGNLPLIVVSPEGSAPDSSGTAKASGKLDVTTPPRYRPRATYAVRLGRRLRSIRADRVGRLAFTLDLGPSHTRQQRDFGAGATRHWRTARARIGGME